MFMKGWGLVGLARVDAVGELGKRSCWRYIYIKKI